jgi:glycosyltransferase involved in cell wall biosynthesis
MNPRERISLVVCTKNRVKDLSECLRSIMLMNEKPDELVVIDNNSIDNTKNVVLGFKKSSLFPVRYTVEKKTGYPAVYNRGISEARYDWVAFIDDDCIATAQWLSSLQTAIKHNSNIAAILGRSDTMFSTNLFSLATMFNIWYWKRGAIKGSHVIDLEVLDNKNIAYNRTFLQKHGIRFSNKRSLGWEDCDVGMQIQKVGGKAVYAEGVLVLHKDPVMINDYLKKIYHSTVAGASYRNTWSTFRKSLGLGKPEPGVLRALPSFTKFRHLSIMQISMLVLILYFTYVYIKVLPLFNKHIYP